ncbi:nucleotidyltransferase family protein [Tamlana flava]|uniref:nucleotidyltransferase family protein n=1 Tax=Tamlana flava TaxID=3158572 RepID=UPI00351BDAAC
MSDTNKANIPIVVLAAGASNRMGRLKQLLKWGDTTLMGHTINAALNSGVKDVFVVLGAHYITIEKSIEQESVKILVNEEWKQGLGSSISFAANYLLKSNLKIEGVLFMLADQPTITFDFLNELIQKFEPNKSQIIATDYENGKYGVPVVFDRIYLGALSKLKGDDGAKLLIKENQSLVRAIKPSKKNVDLDTIEDYNKLLNKTFEE